MLQVFCMCQGICGPRSKIDPHPPDVFSHKLLKKITVQKWKYVSLANVISEGQSGYKSCCSGAELTPRLQLTPS